MSSRIGVDGSQFHRAPNQPADRLVVIAHGFRGTPTSMRGVLEASRAAYPDADIYLPLLQHGGGRCLFLSLAAIPTGIACDIVDRISQYYEDSGGAYRDIVLVGYSAGALIARKVAILAHGQRGAAFESEIARFAGEQQPWARRISRIVLLAGLSRGWSINSALDWITKVKWTIFQFFADISGGRVFLLALRSGSPFMVQTRLQWLALNRDRHPPMVVQLLGTIDDLVSPEDDVDLFVDKPGAGGFLTIEVRGTGHRSIIDMAPPSAGEWVKGHRWTLFVKALNAPATELQAMAIRREHLADSLPSEPDEAATDVVFVIHGIRDKGFWTQKIAREIKRISIDRTTIGGLPRIVHSMTATYGYFAMAPFLFPWIRARKAAWLMDRYTEARARFPNAKISYVGHSNGTYLVARALRDYPAASFHRIVLAGSVVRTDFEWDAYVSAGRIDSLMNYVATKDRVLACFPKAFERLNLFDLGSGGHDGFSALFSTNQNGSTTQYNPVNFTLIKESPCYQVIYIRGGHGSGVHETQWSNIAAFIVDGKPPDSNNEEFTPERPSFVTWIAYLQPFPLLTSIAILTVAVICLWITFWPLSVVFLLLLIIGVAKA